MSTAEILYPTPMYSAPVPRPHIQIVEQPCRSLRYRYGSEGRCEIITGVSSTAENKTPFAIQIVGYQGRVQVVMSCVTKEPPYRSHPHNLVGPNCKKGIYVLETDVSPENSVISFSKIKLQCVKKTHVEDALGVREQRNIDPFSMGFEHKDNSKSINLNVVRLCFQVFLKNDVYEKRPLTPVVSDPIINKKTLSDPLIHRLSHCNSHVNGRKDDIILLCNKISKDDIQIRFFEMEYGQVIWEDFGTFNSNHVYNNTSICFRPPKYRNQDITEPVKVFVQLVRPSDENVSPPVEFEYLPLEEGPLALKEKRKKYQISPLFEQLLQDVGNPRKKRFNYDLSSVDASNNFLVDTTPWQPEQTSNLPNLPLILNNIDQDEPSTSRRTSGQEDVATWNITTDEFGTNLNFENSGEIRRVLDLDYGQMQLEPIHISSGDFEMNDVNRLSGSFQEHLVL